MKIWSKTIFFKWFYHGKDQRNVPGDRKSEIEGYFTLFFFKQRFNACSYVNWTGRQGRDQTCKRREVIKERNSWRGSSRGRPEQARLTIERAPGLSVYKYKCGRAGRFNGGKWVYRSYCLQPEKWTMFRRKKKQLKSKCISQYHFSMCQQWKIKIYDPWNTHH